MLAQKFLEGEKGYKITEESKLTALENLPEVIKRFIAIEKTKGKIQKATKQIIISQNKEAAYTKLDRILTQEKLTKKQCEKKLTEKSNKEDKKTEFETATDLKDFLIKWCDSINLSEDYVIETVEKLDSIRDLKNQMIKEISTLEENRISLEELEKNFSKNSSTLTNTERIQLNEEKENFSKDLEGIVYYKDEPMVYDELTYFIQNYFVFKIIRITYFITKTVTKETINTIKFILPIIEKEIRKRKKIKNIEITKVLKLEKRDFTPKEIISNINIVSKALIKQIKRRKKKETKDLFTKEKIQKFTKKGVKITK